MYLNVIQNDNAAMKPHVSQCMLKHIHSYDKNRRNSSTGMNMPNYRIKPEICSCVIVNKHLIVALDIDKVFMLENKANASCWLGGCMTYIL